MPKKGLENRRPRRPTVAVARQPSDGIPAIERFGGNTGKSRHRVGIHINHRLFPSGPEYSMLHHEGRRIFVVREASGRRHVNNPDSGVAMNLKM